jgi:hypothetical protein
MSLPKRDIVMLLPVSDNKWPNQPSVFVPAAMVLPPQPEHPLAGPSIK